MRFESILKVISILLFIFLFIFVSLLSVKVYFWDDIYEERKTNEREYAMEASPTTTKTEPIDAVELEETIKNPKKVKNKPFTVLLLGVDTKDLKGRTDTIMVAVVNPEKKSVSLLSIPRDTRVNIHGKGMDKINHAHVYGLNTAIYTVEDFLQIPIDYYTTINLNGFTDLIDAIGGLEVNVEKNIAFHDRLSGKRVNLNKGIQELSGEQALHYARFRGDGEGDFGRIRRQQQIITEIIDQTVSLRNVSNVNDILKAVGKNIKTDISFTDMTKMLLQLSDITGANIDRMKINASTGMIGGVSYVLVSEEEVTKIQKELKEKLSAQTNE